MIGSRATLDTPVGPFTTVVDADGVVLAAGWTTDPRSRLLPTIHAALAPAEIVERDDLGPVTRAVRAWLAGDPSAIATVPVRQHGGPFAQEAWARMREVPAGAPVSYGELAAVAGRPLAARGVGQACRANVIGLFVPCHRIRRADGSLGDFRWGGVEVKAKLLEMEAERP